MAPESTEKIWTDDSNLSQLAGAADAAAKKQIHEELHSHSKEVTDTIVSLNESGNKFSMNLSNSENVSREEAREKKFLLLRAVTFQLWMKSNRSEMDTLRKYVVSQIQQECRASSSSCNKKKSTIRPLHPPASPVIPLPADLVSNIHKKRLRHFRPRRTSKQPSIFAPSAR